MFTIRPNPMEGESFIGFLLRVAEYNGVQIQDIYQIVSNGINPRLSLHLLDINPNKYIDPTLMNQVLDISSEQLREMSLRPLLEKLVDNPDGDYIFKDVIQLFDHQYRKFCPECLREKGYFKLIWQIKEIKICDVHLKKLRNSCAKCGGKQLYTHPNLREIECCHCRAKLTWEEEPQSDKTQDKKYIEQQLRKHRDWIYLISPDISFPKIQGFPTEKSLAIFELFLAQGKEKEYNPYNIKYLAQNQIKLLQRIIKGSIRSKYPNLSILLELVRNCGLTVEEFSKLQISEKYYQGIIKIKQTPSDTFACRTPWCLCSSEEKLKKNKKGDSIFCVDCGVRYKKKSDGTWVEDGGQINKIIRVKELAEEGYSKQFISKESGIPQDILEKMRGYLLYHGLVRPQVQQRLFAPECMDNNTIRETFLDILSKQSTVTAKNYAGKKYGLTPDEFYYHLASPEVQEILDSNRRRKKARKEKRPLAKTLHSTLNETVKYNIKITKVLMAKELGVSMSTIDRMGLSQKISTYQKVQRERIIMEKAKYFIDNTRNKGFRIFSASVYGYLQINKKRLKRLYPEVEQYISHELIKEGLKYGKLDYATLRVLTEEAVKSLRGTKRIITLNDVADSLGCTVEFLKMKWKVKPFLIEMGVEV